MESSEHNWANTSKTICPGMLIFDKEAFWMLFFHNTPKNPIISQIKFLSRHTSWWHVVFPICPKRKRKMRCSSRPLFYPQAICKNN